MAVLRAATAFFELDFDLSKGIYAQFTSQVLDNANTTVSGKVYQDVVAYEYAGQLPMTMDFGGTGLTVATDTSLNGGTVTGISDFWGRIGETTNPHFALQGISVSAASIGAAQLTQSTEDDLQVLATALSGNDRIYLSADVDWISGYAGDDLIYGYGGGDLLYGNDGNDKLIGGEGDDELEGGAGNDILYGGNGIDTVAYLNATAGVTVNIALTAAQNTRGAGVDTLSSFERLYGSNFNDTLTGNNLANEIIGMDGADIINGGRGNDRIDGAGGKDRLTGGAGADDFVVFTFFSSTLDRDVITDFSHAQGDHVLLSKQTFTGLSGDVDSALSDAQFYSKAGATAAHDADDRLIYNPTSGALYYDADGLGGTAAVRVLTFGVDTHPALVASDFELSF